MKRSLAAIFVIGLLTYAAAQTYPGGAGGIIAGAGGTTITGCSNTQVPFSNNGVITCDAGLTKVAGSGGAIAAGGAFSATGVISTGAGTLQLNPNGQVATFGGILLRGTVATLTGSCTTGSQVGGQFAGTFTATCTAAQTIIMTFGQSATNGYSCDARDRTTPADAINQTATSVNSATFSAPSGTTASDVIQFHCIGY